MDPEHSTPTPEPTGRAPRRVRRPRKGTIGLLVVGLLFGFASAIIGIVQATEGPVTTPTCDGASMSPGDTCVETTYIGNDATGSQTFSYDDMLSRQQDSHSAAAVEAGIGAVLAAGCGWGVYRWRRNRASYQATQSAPTA